VSSLRKKLKALKTALKKVDGAAVVVAEKEPKNEKVPVRFILGREFEEFFLSFSEVQELSREK